MNAVYTHHEFEAVRAAVQTLPRLPKSEGLKARALGVPRCTAVAYLDLTPGKLA